VQITVPYNMITHISDNSRLLICINLTISGLMFTIFAIFNITVLAFLIRLGIMAELSLYKYQFMNKSYNFLMFFTVYVSPLQVRID